MDPFIPQTPKKTFFEKIKSYLPSSRQIKYSHTVFTSTERNTIMALFGVVAIGIIWLGVLFYVNNVTTIATKGGSYTEGVIGSPVYINPVLAQTNDVDLDISTLIFSRLLKYDENQILVPDLATHYEINENGTEYIFHLRKDALWQGSEEKNVTASDVLFTIQKIQSPEINSPLQVSLQGVEAQMIDEYTIKFTLSKAFAPFPTLLTFGILPAHAWSDVPDQNMRLSELNFKPIGSGPWQVKSLSKDKKGTIRSVVLIPHDRYYNAQPYLEKVTFKFFTMIEEAMAGLERKEIDGLSFVSKKDIEELLKKNKSLNSHLLQIPQYTALFFQHSNNESLKDKSVRKAMALAIDKNAIVQEALNHEGQTIKGPILPGMLGYAQDLEDYAFNVEEAAKILEDAGWKSTNRDEYINELIENAAEDADIEQLKNIFEGYTTIRVKKDTVLSTSITTVDIPENMKTASLIKDAWASIGIVVETKITPAQTIKNEIIKDRNYEILLFGHIIGPDPDPYPFWHSSQIEDPGLNLSGFFNKEADKLLVNAQETKDLEERADLYKEFQTILKDELPAIFLYNPTYNYLVSSKIKGLSESINIVIPADRFNRLSQWYIKTKRALTK